MSIDLTGKLHPSVSWQQGAWRVDGWHRELGGGILGFYRSKGDAEDNAKLIQEHGGEAEVLPNTLLPSKENGEKPHGWLMVDDWRDYHSTGVARNYDEAIELLSSIRFEGLMIDYDLGPNSLLGIDVLKWALEEGVLPKFVEVISSHPFGCQRLVGQLKEAGYVYDNKAKSEISIPSSTRGMDDVYTFEGFWRKPEEGEEKPRRKVVVYLNR